MTLALFAQALLTVVRTHLAQQLATMPTVQPAAETAKGGSCSRRRHRCPLQPAPPRVTPDVWRPSVTSAAPRRGAGRGAGPPHPPRRRRIDPPHGPRSATPPVGRRLASVSLR